MAKEKPAAKLKPTTGYSKNSLPYLRIGNSPRVLVVFEGLGFENKPPSGLQLRMVAGDYKKFAKDYTVYSVGRKPNLPEGYSTRDMAKDYATMIQDEIGKPVDVLGISTGGVIAQHFALDYPDLVHHLVLASTGYRLSETGKKLQLHVGDMARQGKWRKAYTAMMDGVYPKGGMKKRFFKLLMWFVARAPEKPSDLLITIDAEDKHNLKDQIGKIKVPTLLVGGEEDYFYPIRETAAAMPNAEVIIYEKFGHNAWLDNRRQFHKDVLSFLNKDAS